MEAKDIFTEIPHPLPEELIQILLEGRDFRLERIVSHGHSTPTDDIYDQPWHEWVILLSGKARLWIEDEGETELKPGSHCLLPAHCRHRVLWTAPDADTVWLALHFRPEATSGR